MLRGDIVRADQLYLASAVPQSTRMYLLPARLARECLMWVECVARPSRRPHPRRAARCSPYPTPRATTVPELSPQECTLAEAAYPSPILGRRSTSGRQCRRLSDSVDSSASSAHVNGLTRCKSAAGGGRSLSESISGGRRPVGCKRGLGRRFRTASLGMRGRLPTAPLGVGARTYHCQRIPARNSIPDR